jgi:hypothetical protein
MAVTTPPLTVAIVVLDDCQVAWLVTVCVLESDSRAVAEHCTVAVPEPHATTSADSVGGEVGLGPVVVGDIVLLPHAAIRHASAKALTNGPASRPTMRASIIGAPDRKDDTRS